MFDFRSYYEASTVQDAVTYKKEHPEACIINGGTDVLIKMREKKLTGKELLSIGRIPELKQISVDEDGTLHIGAAVAFHDLTLSDIIQTAVPGLGYAADQVGGPQIRNMGTIGGNICNGVSSADTAPMMLCLNAKILLAGAEGERLCPVPEFYAGAGRTHIRPDEIAVEFQIAQEDYAAFGQRYIKYAMRNAMDISTINCAVCVKLDADKEHIEAMRIAMGVVAPYPVRLYETEKALTGQKIADAISGSDVLLEEILPRTSWRASAEFRQHIGASIFKNALTDAIKAAGGTV